MLLTLLDEKKKLVNSLQQKDNEIKSLQLKVMRLQNFDSKKTANSRQFINSEEVPNEEAESSQNSVMITQRGQKLATDNKNSVYCPFT